MPRHRGVLAQRIVEEGDAYGRGTLYDGVTINVEFVSANPTGPLHIGGTRWAAVGDSLSRVFEAQGGIVTREYYFNDHGIQIDRFARSLVAAHLGEPAPDDGYGGAYILEIAARVEADYPGGAAALRDLPRDEAQEVFRELGVNLMFAEVKASLHDFGVDFDVFTHENTLHESGAVERAIDRLRALGHIFESDGATWLRTTEFGDDKDRVIIKKDGEGAYMSGDLAYYLNKRERGFERNIIILGADHHGYVRRLMAMTAAFGDVPYVNLEIIIGQQVNLMQNGEPVRMSKRAGHGRHDGGPGGCRGRRCGALRPGAQLDRFVARHRPRSAHPQDQRQPGVLRAVRARPHPRRRAQRGVGGSRPLGRSTLRPSSTRPRASCSGVLAEFPRILLQAAELREPHRVARYLEELAGAYHRWYDACRVIPLGDGADRGRAPYPSLAQRRNRSGAAQRTRHARCGAPDKM